MDNIYSLLDNMKTEYLNDQTKAQEIYPPNTIPLSRRDGPDITYILETNISSNYNLYNKENARFNSEFYKLCSELIELSNCGKKLLNETDYNNWCKYK